jgi:hypothetical protein
VIRQLFADEKLFKTEDKSSPAPAIAFFYFDFRDKKCQSVEIALRRIILQLSSQSPYPYKTLDEEYGQRLPSYEDLHRILQKLLRELRRTYIVLDALDECDDFDQVVDLVLTLRKWTDTPLHFLITSQTRQIFTNRFKAIPRIALGFDVTQDDIITFVAAEIQTNSKLVICRSQADRIIDQVARKSNGM